MFSFLFFFLICSLSFVSYLLCLLSLCCSSSYSPRFCFFFILCFSFHVSSPCVCLSLSFMLLLFIPFKTITFIHLVFFSIFFRSSLLAKLFLFYLICCFAPFSHLLFFSIVFFRTREIDRFFLWQKNKLFNPSKNFFSAILSFHV